MDELLGILTKVGVPGFLLILGAYVLLKHVLPHWKDRSTAEQVFRHSQSQRIQEREDGILKDVAGLIRQNISESQTMTQRMDVLTEEIREEHRAKRR